ncbi:MAG TPA: hypothetical protein PLZ61_07335, partial [Candidatus Cryosericum sp.]|nr:hypothetical protein [Candidatus Cryosericum sp.]
WYYGMAEELPYDGLSTDDMFLTYVDLKEANQLDMLVRLLAQPERFGFLLHLLVPETGDFHSYSAQRFLNAAQSLECLHRRTGLNGVVSSEEFMTKVNRILKSVAEEDRAWLKERLQRGNEPSLRHRILAMVQANAALLQTTVDQEESFVKDVRDTRNFFVHLDSRRSNRVLKGLELINATDKLEALARISFLREIGFDDQSLVNLFAKAKCPYIKHAKQLFQSQD